MTDWTTITDSQVDPDAPITSGLGYAWRDNPIAISEGSAGAPRVQTLAMVGFAGKVQHGTGATEAVLTFNHPQQRIRATLYTSAAIGGAGANPILTMRASADGGATWSADQSIFQVAESANARIFFGEFELDMLTGVWTFIGTQSISAALTLIRLTGTMTVPANIDALGFRFTGTIASSAPIGRHTVYSVGVA